MIFVYNQQTANHTWTDRRPVVTHETVCLEEEMTEETTYLGSIHVSPRAIATIVYHAALQSYGVVGLASKNLMDGITQVLVKDPTKGIEVQYDGQEIKIDLYIIVEYGTRVKSVANSISNTVRFQVEKALGMPVGEVNVHIRGLRISSVD